MNTKIIQGSLSDEKVGYKTMYGVIHVLSNLFLYTEKNQTWRIFTIMSIEFISQ